MKREATCLSLWVCVPLFLQSRAMAIPTVNADKQLRHSSPRKGNIGRLEQLHKLVALGAGAMFISGCANLPDKQQINYYYPKAQTHIAVVQTLGCTSSNNHILSEAQVLVTTTYVAGTSAPPLTLGSFDGSWNDHDIDLNFTDDGRLKGINATSSGEGGTVLKGVASTVGAIVTAGALGTPFAHIVGKKHQNPSALSAADQNIIAACTAISDLASTDKPSDPKLVTLTYRGDFEYNETTSQLLLINPNDPLNTSAPSSLGCPSIKSGAPSSLAILAADNDSAGLLNAAKGALQPYAGSFCVGIQDSATQGHRSEWPDGTGKPSNYFPLTLKNVQKVSLQVWGPGQSFDPNHPLVIWKGIISAPGNGTYTVLVPKGSFVGSEKFALALADDGSISEIRYGKSGNASDTAGALQGIAQALPSKEKELEDENNLIYQEQRHIICTTTPSSCK